MWINGMYVYVNVMRMWVARIYESSRFVWKGNRKNVWPKMQKSVKWTRKVSGRERFENLTLCVWCGAWVRVYFLIYASVQNNLIASVLFWNAAITTITFTYKHIHKANWCFVHIRMKAFVKIYTFPHAIRINNSTNDVPVAFTTGTVFVIKIPPICSA